MKKHSPGFERISEAARREIRETTAADVKARLARQEKFVLLDVREDHEWAVDHLPHAEHLSRGILERDVEKRFPDANAPIVLYCGGGYRSALAALSLKMMGYTNVLSLAGGYRGWVDQGYELEKTATAAK